MKFEAVVGSMSQWYTTDFGQEVEEARQDEGTSESTTADRVKSRGLYSRMSHYDS